MTQKQIDKFYEKVLGKKELISLYNYIKSLWDDDRGFIDTQTTYSSLLNAQESIKTMLSSLSGSDREIAKSMTLNELLDKSVETQKYKVIDNENEAGMFFADMKRVKGNTDISYALSQGETEIVPIIKLMTKKFVKESVFDKFVKRELERIKKQITENVM